MPQCRPQRVAANLPMFNVLTIIVGAHHVTPADPIGILGATVYITAILWRADGARAEEGCSAASTCKASGGWRMLWSLSQQLMCLLHLPSQGMVPARRPARPTSSVEEEETDLVDTRVIV
eukprot:scaffold1983_cov376-Prasinococcus_capsulatus_cf.AAC.11